jgi:pilus assembly protein Flp/PilA
MKNTIQQFLREEDGVAAIEYGLLAALIAVGIITAANTLGGNISTLFTNIGAKLSGTAIPA